MGVFEAIAEYNAQRANPHIGKLMSYCCTVDEALVLYMTALLHRPDVIFECGTAVGWSSMWLGMGANQNEHHRTNPPYTYNTPVFTFDPAARIQLFNEEHVTKINLPYDTAIAEYASRYRGKKKIFFIDGDHRHGAIKRDWRATEPFVEIDDVVIFHDVLSEAGSIEFDRGLCESIEGYRRYLYETRNGIVVYMREA